MQKGRERKHKSKVKAGPATNSSCTTTKTGHKQSMQNITDLRRNLLLCNEADEALNVLGVPLNTGAAAESSDSSAQESDGPRRRVKNSSKSRSNKKSSHVKPSHKDNAKRAESMFDGWGRLGLSEAPSEGQWSGFEESVVMWPNENLGPCYNNYSKAETKYRQLDMRTLVAGELNIVCDCGVSMREREARLRLLGDVNFYSAHYQWSALLKFHAAVLSEVERGRMEWGDDYSRLEQQMLMPFPLGKSKTERRAEKGPGSGAKAISGSGRNEDRVLYCAEFQNNACHFHNDHVGGSSSDSRHCFSTFVRYAGRNQKYGHSIQLRL